MADFSPAHVLKGFFAPVRFEADVIDCVVTGTIPPELDGAFYRMHGDWIYAPKFADEASLSADGYISMFRFRNGSSRSNFAASATRASISSRGLPCTRSGEAMFS